MNLLQKFLNMTDEPPSKSLKIVAGVTAIQSVTLAYFLLKAGKVVKVNEDRLEFLYDIVGRNVEHLTEFDLIALKELGLFEEAS